MKPSPVMSVFTCQHMEKEKTRTYTCLLEGRGGSAREGGKGENGESISLYPFPLLLARPFFPPLLRTAFGGAKGRSEKEEGGKGRSGGFFAPWIDNFGKTSEFQDIFFAL